MFESVVITLIDGTVSSVSEVLLADMAGLEEGPLIEKMKSFGYTPLLRIYSELLRIYSEEVDLPKPVLLTFTKRKIYGDSLSAEIDGV